MAHTAPTFIDSSYANNMAGASTSISASIPALAQTDDYVLAFIHTVGATVSTVPSGWTLGNSYARTGTSTLYVYYKKIGASEPTPSWTVSASQTGHQITLVAYRGVGAVRQVTGTASAGVTDPQTMNSVTTVFDNSVIVYNVDSASTASGSYTWTNATERTDTTIFTTAGLNGSIAEVTVSSPSTVSNVTADLSVSLSSGNSSRAVIVLDPVNRMPVYKGASSAAITTAGTSLAVTYPTSNSGDFLLMSVAAGNTTANTVAITTPTGWTLAGNLSNSGMEGSVYWRFRGAETSVTVSHGSAFSNAVIHAYEPTNIDPNFPIHVIAGDYNAVSSGTMSVPSVATTVDDIAVSMFTHAKRASSALSYTVSTWSQGTATTVNTSSAGFGTHFLRASATDMEVTATTYAATTVTYSVNADRKFVAIVGIQAPQSANVSDGDTGAGTETSTTRAYTGTQNDSGTATETASQRVSGAVDSGSGTDTSAVAAGLPASDTAAGIDTATVRVYVPGSDTGTGTESAFATNTALAADTATGADTASVFVWGAADSGTGTDSAVGFASDTGSGTDTAPKVFVVATDSATGTDNASATNTAQTGDNGSIVDNTATVRFNVSDTVTSNDTASLNASVVQNDSATFTEGAKVIVVVVESGTATDTSKIVLKPNDTGTSSENGSIVVTVFGTDVGTLTDTGGIKLYDSDSGAGTEGSFKFISGQLQAARLTVVAEETRTLSIDAEARLIRVEPDSRVFRIEPEPRMIVPEPRPALVVIGAEA